MATADLMADARAGNGDAFRELTEPHRRELQVYCYRMLGSLHDAEDALQDTFLSAWQGLGAFEGRASLRTWLYRIATNRCLNMRRSATRRQAKEWDVAGVQPPDPTRLGEVVWLEPIPDAILDDASDWPLGPAARYERTESISLAFVTAVQLCRRDNSLCSSCAMSSDSMRVKSPRWSTRASSRSTVLSNVRGPACSVASHPTPTASRHPPSVHAPKRPWWPSSCAPTNLPICRR